MLRTRLVLFTMAFVLLVSARGPANAQAAQSPLPQPTGHVNDYAGVIDGATKTRLETMLANLDRQQQIPYAVVTIDTTAGQEIFDYSVAVARGWGHGSQDAESANLLLQVAINDSKH